MILWFWCNIGLSGMRKWPISVWCGTYISAAIITIEKRLMWAIQRSCPSLLLTKARPNTRIWLAKCVTLKSEWTIFWGSSDVRKTKWRRCSLGPLIRERRGRTGTKKDIVVSWVCHLETHRPLISPLPPVAMVNFELWVCACALRSKVKDVCMYTSGLFGG